MAKIVFLFSFLFSVFAIESIRLTNETLQCSPYMCSEDDKSPCVEELSSNITIYECSNDKVCLYSLKGDITAAVCGEKTEDSKLQCSPMKDSKENCNFADYCKEGYFCEEKDSGNFKCEERAKEDHPCSQLYECEEETVCNLGNCIEYFSINDYQPADSNIACKSGIVKNSICQPEEVTDFPGDSKDDDNTDESKISLKECLTDGDCTAKDGITAGTCVCGYGQDGKSYCLPHRSDSITKKLLKASYDWNAEKVAYRVSKLNTYILRENIKEYGKINDEESCLTKSKEYQEYSKSHDLAKKCSSASILTLGLLIAFIN